MGYKKAFCSTTVGQGQDEEVSSRRLRISYFTAKPKFPEMDPEGVKTLLLFLISSAAS